MKRKFKKPDYTAKANAQISLGEAIPANHLARFVVDIAAQLDLSTIYARYGVLGGEAIAPEVWCLYCNNSIFKNWFQISPHFDGISGHFCENNVITRYVFSNFLPLSPKKIGEVTILQ
jgi:hypothetical protein